MFENLITFFRASADAESQSQTDAASCEEDYLTVSLSSFLGEPCFFVSRNMGPVSDACGGEKKTFLRYIQERKWPTTKAVYTEQPKRK